MVMGVVISRSWGVEVKKRSGFGQMGFCGMIFVDFEINPPLGSSK
jgi:hypothetical protein